VNLRVSSPTVRKGSTLSKKALLYSRATDTGYLSHDLNMKRDYIEFQDRSEPLAFFLSFRGYGTWLHGDERFSMDRKQFNTYGGDKMPSNIELQKKEYSNLKNEPFLFDGNRRMVIEKAIREVCKFRGYQLIALNIRTNHVHCVVKGAVAPELILNSFKSYATRHLRNELEISKEIRVWSRHGSTRYLWTDEQIEFAVDYVINGQGDELPDFK
jgi:REP element-mobilizing transposase RayT